MKEKLKFEIIHETKKLIHEGKTVNEITMDLIAKRLKMTAPTLYHYFKSKDDIIGLSYEMIADELLEVFNTPLPSSMDPAMKLKTRLVTLMSYFKANPNAFTLIFTKGAHVKQNPGALTKKLNDFIKLLQSTTHEWVKSKKLKVSGVKATFVLLSLIMGHLYYQEAQNIKGEVSDKVEEVFELFEKSVS